MVFHGAKRGTWSALMTVPEVKQNQKVKYDKCNEGARDGEVHEET